MIQLVLLLFGSKILRQYWWALLIFGLLWMALGLFFFVDALFGDNLIPLALFTIPLILDGLWSYAAARNRRGTAKLLRLGKSCAFLCIALLILAIPQHSGFVVGMLVGTFLCVDGGWRGVSAITLRYTRWKNGLVFAFVEIVFGIWSFVPWPSHWEGEIGADVGTLLVFSAAGACALALRIKRLRPDMPILSAMDRGWPEASELERGTNQDGENWDPAEVIVHVWTPTETLAPVHHGISRYIAAKDARGVVSTGHAALELPPDVYISHYPAVEIDRDELTLDAFRTTEENDIAGRFLPSYAVESAEWTPSTFQVVLPGLNGAAIRRFWQLYQRDLTYNLTNRSCACAVAKALDAGLDGFLAQAGRGFFGLLFRLLATPEAWVAGFMRLRADAMTWTPGMVLDYARALSCVTPLSKKRPSEDRTKRA
ncbi:MAG: DUF308 domain-containing protein [Burkholderiales bacterium]|jgi:uncharacterized membrane protein HdeD (DUF308 family)|nr:DUF308 domain-containing protein [Burkholderiales bacterium]